MHSKPNADHRHTLRTWQQRTNRELTPRDAMEIATNVGGFLQVLLEWDATARRNEAKYLRLRMEPLIVLLLELKDDPSLAA